MTTPGADLGSKGVLQHGGAIVACVAIVLAATVAWRVSADNSLPAPGWVVTVTPTSNLLDGDTITVNVKANPDVSITNLEIRECRFNATYVDQSDNNPRAGNCPLNALSTSADPVIVKSASDGLVSLARSDHGADVSFHVGSGTTEWDSPTGKQSLTCDVSTNTTNPCGLVVQVRVGSDYTYQVARLAFTDADPLKACGGTAPGILGAEAADEVADAWSLWTRNFCAANPGGAPTSTAFTSEGDALNSYELGNRDIVYGSSGVDPAAGMVAAMPRNTVAVPVALNAAVLAVGGGRRTQVDANGQPVGDKVPYPTLQMEAKNAAALLSGGLVDFQNDDLPYRQAVLRDNPVLAPSPGYIPAPSVLAPSQPLTATWLLTSYFTAVTPQDWLARRQTPPQPRGATSSLALANPGFPNTTTLTGRPAFQKITFPASINPPDGPLWVFTDRATATSLKLTPVAFQNAAGTGFVAPDAASMTAAVASMKAGSDGVLHPVIAAASASDTHAAAVDAYPLTYVVYAFAPAEPLVDATCATRPDSQKLLTKWLQYVTGAGQKAMAPGLEPLPDSLAAQASAAIAKIGTAPVTGACAGKVHSPGGADAPGSSGSAGSSSAGGAAGNLASTGLPSGFSTPGFSTLGGVQPPTGSAAAADSASTPAANGKGIVPIPAFAGHTLADPVGGVIALLGIVVVMSLGAWVTSGGRLSGGEQWTPGSLGALTPGRVGSLVLLWGGIGVAGIGLVLFQLGPLLEQRDQRSLLSRYKTAVAVAANETQGLAGATEVSKPPELGDPVGILEIGALKTQDVVVEGAGASATREGPGHVPGTSGLGQPGNAVVVARRNGYGGAFANLNRLRKGDRVVVTTTQGQSVYAVRSVRRAIIDETGADPGSSTTTKISGSVTTSTTAGTSTTTGASSSSSTSVPPTAAPSTSVSAGSATTTTTTKRAKAAAVSRPRSAEFTSTKSATAIKTVDVGIDKLYGPSSDDRLTLVTSASKVPWNSSEALVVTARLLSKPFAPTPQGARSGDQTGTHGDADAWAAVVLALMGFLGVIVASVMLYRKVRFRVAYVLTIAPLVAATIVTGETLARLLPAWT